MRGEWLDALAWLVLVAVLVASALVDDQAHRSGMRGFYLFAFALLALGCIGIALQRLLP